jgi:aryl-alcohol dehydrogenase-like predicted oxidoreductase
MRQLALGQQGLVVSALGLGIMGMTMAYGPSDEQEGIAAIRRAYELGGTFFDTAELYGRGTGSNEKLVGQAVAPFRDEVDFSAGRVSHGRPCLGKREDRHR